MLHHALYEMLSCTLWFFLSVVQVSVTRAICLWLKKRWTDSWKVMIFDSGQISEVIFSAFSSMCPEFFQPCQPVRWRGVYFFEIISMSTRLPRNQKSSSLATPTPHAWGWFVHDMSKQPEYQPSAEIPQTSTFLFFFFIPIQKQHSGNMACEPPAVHARWNLIQLSARSCLYPRSS